MLLRKPAGYPPKSSGYRVRSIALKANPLLSQVFLHTEHCLPWNPQPFPTAEAGNRPGTAGLKDAGAGEARSAAEAQRCCHASPAGEPSSGPVGTF